jgi:hypothetical protein
MRAPAPINPKTRKPEPSPLVPDPERAPVVAEIYRRRAAGETWTTIRDWLNGDGITTLSGARWSCGSVARLIPKTTYLGVASGGHANDPPKPDAHPALIDEATWHAAQSRVGMRRDRREAPTVVRGLVRCAGCRYTMHFAHSNGGSGWRYVCTRDKEGGDCPSPSGIVALGPNGRLGLDEYVIERMFDDPEHGLKAIEFKGLDAALDDLERAATEARERFERAAADAELEEVLGRAAFLKRMATLRADADTKQDEPEQALGVAGRAGSQPVADLRNDWPDMSMDDKRAHLARAVRYVFVRAPLEGSEKPHRFSDDESRRDYLASRVHIVWATDPEIDVPRQGRRDYVVRPFVFPPDADPHKAGIVAA